MWGRTLPRWVAGLQLFAGRLPLLGRAQILLGLVALVTLVGAAGASALGQSDPFWWAWTRMLDTGGLANDSSLGARILGTVITLGGLAVVGGTVMALVEEAARHQLEQFLHGRVPGKLHGHAVVFGSGRHAAAAVTSLLSGKPGMRIVVAVRDPAQLAETRAACGHRANVVVASLSEAEHRRRLQLALCSRVIILAGATPEVGAALGALVEVAKEREAGSVPIRAHIEVLHPELADGLAPALDVSRDQIEIQAVAVAHAGARLALRNHPLDACATAETNRVQLVVIGWSPFACALVWHVLRTAHFGCREKTRVLIVDEDSERIARQLYAEVSDLGEIIELQTATFAPDVRSWGTRLDDVVSVLACGESADDAIARALRFREVAIPGLRQVLVEVPEGSGYEALLHVGPTRRVALHAVGSSTLLMELGDQLDETAKSLHKRYLEQRRGHAQRRGEGNYSDPADVRWEQLDSVRRDWNRASADHADVKLRALARLCKIDPPIFCKGSLHIPPELQKKVHQMAAETRRVDALLKDGPPVDERDVDATLEALARMEHDRWMAERRSEAWILSPDGKTKDNQQKHSPYLIPYADLEPHIKHYDREAVVAALVPLVGIPDDVTKLNKQGTQASNEV